MSDDNDKLGEGWGWWIVLLTLCVFQSCDQSDDNEREIQQLQRQLDIQQLQNTPPPLDEK